MRQKLKYSKQNNCCAMSISCGVMDGDSHLQAIHLTDNSH